MSEYPGHVNDIVENDGGRHQVVVSKALLLFIGIILSHDALPAEGQPFRERVVGLDYSCSMGRFCAYLGVGPSRPILPLLRELNGPDFEVVLTPIPSSEHHPKLTVIAHKY